MQSEVTVVIPAYNAGDVIEKCIESLRAQTILPFIIVVNDGSEDDTELKLKRYENEKEILVINENNMGVSAARNKGIKKCKTKYITFVDPDDQVDNTYISTLKDGFNHSDNIEMSICNFQSDLDGKNLGKYKFDSGIFDKNYVMNKLFLPNSISGSVCNKLFEVEKIKKNQILFDESLNISEDLKFCFDYLINCRGDIAISNVVHYYYHVGKTGLSSRVRIGTKDRITIPNQIKLFVSFLEEPVVGKNNKLEQNIRSLITITGVNFIRSLSFNKDEKNKIYILEIIKSNINFLLSNKQFSNKDKIKAIITLKFRIIISLYDWLKFRRL